LPLRLDFLVLQFVMGRDRVVSTIFQ
jgi:hypothetical protein